MCNGIILIKSETVSCKNEKKKILIFLGFLASFFWQFLIFNKIRAAMRVRNCQKSLHMNKIWILHLIELSWDYSKRFFIA